MERQKKSKMYQGNEIARTKLTMQHFLTKTSSAYINSRKVQPTVGLTTHSLQIQDDLASNGFNTMDKGPQLPCNTTELARSSLGDRTYHGMSQRLQNKTKNLESSDPAEALILLGYSQEDIAVKAFSCNDHKYIGTSHNNVPCVNDIEQDSCRHDLITALGLTTTNKHRTALEKSSSCTMTEPKYQNEIMTDKNEDTMFPRASSSHRTSVRLTFTQSIMRDINGAAIHNSHVAQATASSNNSVNHNCCGIPLASKNKTCLADVSTRLHKETINKTKTKGVNTQIDLHKKHKDCRRQWMSQPSNKNGPISPWIITYNHTSRPTYNIMVTDLFK